MSGYWTCLKGNGNKWQLPHLQVCLKVPWVVDAFVGGRANWTWAWLIWFSSFHTNRLTKLLLGLGHPEADVCQTGVKKGDSKLSHLVTEIRVDENIVQNSWYHCLLFIKVKGHLVGAGFSYLHPHLWKRCKWSIRFNKTESQIPKRWENWHLYSIYIYCTVVLPYPLIQ